MDAVRAPLITRHSIDKLSKCFFTNFCNFFWIFLVFPDGPLLVSQLVEGLNSSLRPLAVAYWAAFSLRPMAPSRKIKMAQKSSLMTKFSSETN